MKADSPPPGYRMPGSARPAPAAGSASRDDDGPRADGLRTDGPRTTAALPARGARGARGGAPAPRGSGSGPAASRRMPWWLRALAIGAALCVIGALVGAMAVAVAWQRLPDLSVLTDYRPKVPMHIYSADNVLIGEFGEERRTIVRIGDVPKQMKQAILAAEDDRFYEHGGIDPSGVARSILANLRTGGRGQGASTITMQLARTFFLSREKSYLRKAYEMLTSLKMEQMLSKDQILEIYANQIYLGQRAYGFGSAAEAYFGKPLKELSLGQFAMLAALPKAPSSDNPITNPRKARDRQLYVLGRMETLGYVTPEQAQAARDEPIRVRTERPALPLRGEWAAEMARQLTVDRFHEEAYTSGLNVYTTIVASDQRAALRAVHDGVVRYDHRHGYRGPEGFADLGRLDGAALADAIDDAVAQAGEVDGFAPAVVLSAAPDRVSVARGSDRRVDITGDGLKFAARWIDAKRPADRQIRRGSVVRIAEGDKGWEITQVPEVEAAFVAVDTTDGAVRAMVGGFDFSRSKFNRVTQSVRQPGSSIKPYIYSAALEKGFMTTTMISDTPVILDPTVTGGQVWEPKNSDGRYEGPMTLRSALARSRNMVTIRILQSIGVDYAQDYLSRFGFTPEKNPAYLTMALGAGASTPWQLAGSISSFANGGFRIEPFLIRRITDIDGREIAAAQPATAGDEERRIIDARNAYIIDSVLRDVVRKGTARDALKLRRNDVAGKTGTTNDAFDAWFTGYAGDIAGVAWVGFDQPASLGDKEFGGGLALPIWIDAMREPLARVPEKPRRMPAGIVQANGDLYFEEIRPGIGIGSLGVIDDGLGGAGQKSDSVRDQIF